MKYCIKLDFIKYDDLIYELLHTNLNFGGKIKNTDL